MIITYSNLKFLRKIRSMIYVYIVGCVSEISRLKKCQNFIYLTHKTGRTDTLNMVLICRIRFALLFKTFPAYKSTCWDSGETAKQHQMKRQMTRTRHQMRGWDCWRMSWHDDHCIVAILWPLSKFWDWYSCWTRPTWFCCKAKLLHNLGTGWEEKKQWRHTFACNDRLGNAIEAVGERGKRRGGREEEERWINKRSRVWRDAVLKFFGNRILKFELCINQFFSPNHSWSEKYHFFLINKSLRTHSQDAGVRVKLTPCKSEIFIGKAHKTVRECWSLWNCFTTRPWETETRKQN